MAVVFETLDSLTLTRMAPQKVVSIGYSSNILFESIGPLEIRRLTARFRELQRI